jgi:hypothetical protein
MGWALFSTTPLGRNWFYDELYRHGLPGPDKDPDIESFVMPTASNPAVPPVELDVARRQLSAKYFQREYLASFDAFHGLVYDEFKEETHVVSESQLRLEYGLGQAPLKKLFRQVIAGVDWGWTSPGCIIVVADTGREFLVLDEVYRKEMITFDPRMREGTWVAEAVRMREQWGVSRFYCDPSSPQNTYDFVRASVDASGACNNVPDGIRRVASALHADGGKPRLRVLAGAATNLLRELKAYRWSKLPRSNELAETPDPGCSDHACDALRYAVYELTRYDQPAREQGNVHQLPRRAHGGPVY